MKPIIKITDVLVSLGLLAMVTYVDFITGYQVMLAQKLVEGAGDQPSLIASLSDRELEVFQLLGRGYNPRQISTQLNVGFKTVLRS